MAESKQAEIPSSTRVWESTVLNVDIDTVWKAIRAVTFKWASDVKSVDVSGDESAVGGTRTINYNDGTKQTVQIMEISDLRKSVTYSVVSSEPAVSYTSAVHQVSLQEVTNPAENVKQQCFLEWKSDYSNDATIAVMEDSRYKKKSAFGDMAKFFTSK
mmetsp:Transcript_47052/g.78099  ORF Transcript_47052/g.78099 Transcript_47052/m.78099 type:complete len:158 (-) Transcript_47052:174-647(-)|eukprot:CAMPEP_0202691594 /NCGR_PEP_ID=MMETSP1385-20130828/6265_1 /ASSEMBLY_ACC=CAM_ASM_000861 /TAXON_ID=933848 /ORGANISM="Elphidium margaritaceum" /LENGTH=157 /DNA_ID=CAMNT_0049347023 /DNA_START=116 /DNA_END=589 /DNA_ORIENTATION=-